MEFSKLFLSLRIDLTTLDGMDIFHIKALQQKDVITKNRKRELKDIETDIFLFHKDKALDRNPAPAGGRTR